jgi:hypothetical protein
MDCDEPHPETQLIQWTERPTATLVAAGSLWPLTQSQQPDEKTQLILRTERPTGALVGGGSLWPFVLFWTQVEKNSPRKKILTIPPKVHLHSFLMQVWGLVVHLIPMCQESGLSPIWTVCHCLLNQLTGDLYYLISSNYKPCLLVILRCLHTNTLLSSPLTPGLSLRT